MTDSKNLMASQQFMTGNFSYEDDLFGLLYQDIGDFAAKRSPRIVSQDRRISIYGVRGVGKTTATQGVPQHVLSTSKDTRVNYRVMGIHEKQIYKTALSSLLPD